MTREGWIVLGVLAIAGIGWLAVVNWHAAVIVLLILIYGDSRR